MILLEASLVNRVTEIRTRRDALATVCRIELRPGSEDHRRTDLYFRGSAASRSPLVQGDAVCDVKQI